MVHSTIQLTEADAARFDSKVDRSGGANACWPWTGGESGGYGTIKVAGKSLKAHRVAYALAKGPVPDGKGVLHDCDNPPCCNPSHLYAGTDADNVADKMARGRHVAPTGDLNGARLHPERILRGDQHPARVRPERCARGDRHGRSVIREADIPVIRAALAEGRALRTIGAEYGVSKQAIWAIKSRRRWGHVA